MAQRRSLGKGLGALLPQEEKDVGELRLDEITPNPDQPRKTFPDSSLEELAQSIRSHGIIQPILVKKKGDLNVIVAGERRWKAASIAGLEKIPVRFFQGDDDEILEVSLIENLQREDLSPIETAMSLQEMIKKLDLTQEEVALKVGWSRSAVANKIRLLNLPKGAIDLLQQGRITEGHARLLLSLGNTEETEMTASKCAEMDWSVKQLAEHLKEPLKKGPKKKPQQTPEWGYLFKENRIKVTQSEKRGKVQITLGGLTKEQADVIGEILCKEGDRLFPGK